MRSPPGWRASTAGGAAPPCRSADSRTPRRPAGRRGVLRRSAVHAPAAPWHCLYFLPLPHGHGALRGVSLVPVTVAVFAALAGPLSLAEASRLGALELRPACLGASSPFTASSGPVPVPLGAVSGAAVAAAGVALRVRRGEPVGVPVP